MDPRVTAILQAAQSGDRAAADELLPLVYDELRRLAAARLAAEKPGNTLQATALVHEAYVRLVDGGSGGDEELWNGRRHFFGAAALAMRRILVDRARAKATSKRGGDLQRLRLDMVDIALDQVPVELLDLDESLQRLAEVDPVKAELVQLRFFAGLTRDEAARVLDISPTTADRHWSFARAWLFRDMSR